MERYELAMERIRLMSSEETEASCCHDFFVSLAGFINEADGLRNSLFDGSFRSLNLEGLKEWNYRLYKDILPENYRESMYNPGFLAEKYGKETGKALSALAFEVRNIIRMIFEGRDEELAAVLELFLEIYGICSDPEYKPEDIEKAIYWYAFDYLDISVPGRLADTFSTDNSFIKDIICGADLSDIRYLYYFGEYISDTELETAVYLNTLSEETVEKMAGAYTSGYRDGFLAAGKKMKRTVSIRYNLGFERVVYAAVRQFEKMGLEVIFTRKAYRLTDMIPGRNAGVCALSPNKQYDYDHRYDSAVFFKKAYTDRRLGMLRLAYEEFKEEAADYGGPAVMEVFGEEGFKPVNNPYAYSYDEKQKKLLLHMQSELLRLQEEYLPQEELSFTIIAWPLPLIAENREVYRRIFDEVIRINTLDAKSYRDMQQIIIDALDRADTVRIRGGAGNETDLTVKLHRLSNPEKETNFENCVADVNIPVGEVFTSPVLKGTEGLLHVSGVYIGDFRFENLRLEFKDGMVSGYSCDNFDTMEENKRLIEELLLKEHESLPMGEFAIGTNTTAYAAAKKFDILGKFPVLIAEKTGPHFAIGDTCYSREEDVMTYNPDGKAIIARENEVSALRHQDMAKAYTGCHTDITIPYDELGDIYTIEPDGSMCYIIKNGKFALEGLEELNKAMENM